MGIGIVTPHPLKIPYNIAIMSSRRLNKPLYRPKFNSIQIMVFTRPGNKFTLQEIQQDYEACQNSTYSRVLHPNRTPDCAQEYLDYKSDWNWWARRINRPDLYTQEEGDCKSKILILVGVTNFEQIFLHMSISCGT